MKKLCFCRILKPCSKAATYDFSNKLLEQPNFEKHHIYRSLTVFAQHFDQIQAELYKNSLKLGQRNTGVIYYDCTNFFFEIEEPGTDGLRQYGKGKENRPLPIVEMGLFIDRDGIPLSLCINPGNTNEQTTMKPLEQKMMKDFDMSKFIVCANAGLSSKAKKIQLHGSAGIYLHAISEKIKSKPPGNSSGSNAVVSDGLQNKIPKVQSK